MKILVYGLPRTRSTFILDVLCQFNKLTYLGEPYHGILAIESKKSFVNYKSKQSKVTLELRQQDNFGLKLFTNGLINWDFVQMNNPLADPKYNTITKNDVIDIYETHDIDMYDKIYIIHRKNGIDRFCSFTQAKQHNNFAFRRGQEKLVKMYSPKNINLDYKYSDLKFFLFCDILHNQLSNQLMSKKNNVIQLEYDDITKFVNDNCPNIESRFTENFYDYKNKIKNYNQISDDFERAKLEFEKDEVAEVISNLFS